MNDYYCPSCHWWPSVRAVVLQVPQDSSTLRKNIYYCKSCSQYLPSTEFDLSSNSKAVGRCQQCSKKTNEAVSRQENTQYTFILQNVCSTEDAFRDNSKIAFLMKVSLHSYLSVIFDRCLIIGGGRGQWLWCSMASAEHEPITGVWGLSPQRGPWA